MSGCVARAAAASAIGSGPLISSSLRVATTGKPGVPTGASCASSVATAIVTTGFALVAASKGSSATRSAIRATPSRAPPPIRTRRLIRRRFVAAVDGERVEPKPIDGLLDQAGDAHGGERYAPRGKWQVPLPFPVDWLTDQSISVRRRAPLGEGAGKARLSRMDFALTDEQREHRDHVRKFSREVIRPVARKHDEEESTPWRSSRRPGSGDSRGSSTCSGWAPTPTASSG